MRNTGFGLRLLLAMVLPLLLATACGGDDESSAQEAASTPATAVPFDRSFIDAMVPHHRSAIDMAREAKAAGLSQAELVTVADDIIESQQAEINQLLNWREQWFGAREIDPNGASQLGMSTAGMGMDHDPGAIADAEDVDQAFAAAMIPHHEGAIAMARMAQEKAQHKEIAELAAEIITAQEREIDILRPHAGEGGHDG